MIQNNINTNKILIVNDFPENYTCKYANQIQSVHLGASQKQVPLYTGALLKEVSVRETQCESFCNVCGDLRQHAVGHTWIWFWNASKLLYRSWMPFIFKVMDQVRSAKIGQTSSCSIQNARKWKWKMQLETPGYVKSVTVGTKRAFVRDSPLTAATFCWRYCADICWRYCARCKKRGVSSQDVCYSRRCCEWCCLADYERDWSAPSDSEFLQNVGMERMLTSFIWII